MLDAVGDPFYFPGCNECRDDDEQDIIIMIKQTSKKKGGKSVGHAEEIKTAALESFRDAEGAALAIVDGLASVTAPLA